MRTASVARHGRSGKDRLTRRHAAATILALAGLSTLAASPLAAHAATPTAPGFSHVTVDPNLAGGEPFVSFVTTPGGGSNLVYSSHEGTTHLFRDGIASPSNACNLPPTTPPQTLPDGFVCSYTNQVNVWTSDNQGNSWNRTTVGPNGVGPTSPFGLGFSDPDLTQDEGHITYDTGIDLANDSVFASADGGKSFPIGNNNCHEGDRPWLAGGVANEVFLATDTVADANTSLSSGHSIFHGVITPVAGGQSTLQCFGRGGQPDPAGVTSTGIPDYGPWQNTGSYGAVGKLFYDHNAGSYRGSLIEPAVFSNANKSPGVGISVLKGAASAFATTAHFVQYEVPNVTSGVFAHWPSIAIDANDVVYLTWDTNVVNSQGKLDNAIMLATFDLRTLRWSTPIQVAKPGTSVLWPWVAAGGPGNAAVVWYQYDGLTNPDAGTGKVSIMESTILGAGGATPTVEAPVDAVGKPIHVGGLCQGGTTCVATGQDRRLGDFFTDAVDRNGCVMIASGETTTDPAAATSRPVFIKQTSGTGLTGLSCAIPGTALPEAPRAALLLLGAGLAAAVVAGRRRHRRGQRVRAQA